MGNAFRHSGAHSIEAELNYERSELRVRIRDDGTGIDSEILRQGHREGHFGLPGMRERAQRVGAHLDVWSGSGAGTEVELRIAAAHCVRFRAERFHVMEAAETVERHETGGLSSRERRCATLKVVHNVKERGPWLAYLLALLGVEEPAF